MKKKLSFPRLTAFLICLIVEVAGAFAQSCFCDPNTTPVGFPPGGGSNGCYPDNPKLFYVKIYMHVIHDGNDGYLTQQEVESAFNTLENDYNPLQIYFVWDCSINYIDNQEYYDRPIQPFNNPPYSNFETYTATYNHEDGIDIYLLGPGGAQGENPYYYGGGHAAGIVSGAFVVAGFELGYWNPPSFNDVPVYDKSFYLSHEIINMIQIY